MKWRSPLDLEAQRTNTHSQITSIQVHLLLELGQELIVEGFQLEKKRKRFKLTWQVLCGKWDNIQKQYCPVMSI